MTWLTGYLMASLYQPACGPFWDNASCVPPTAAGHSAVFPCMTMFAGKLYNTQGESASQLARTDRDILASKKATFRVFVHDNFATATKVGFCGLTF